MDEELLGEEIDVVVLAQQDDHTVPVTATTPITLDEATEPVGEHLAALLDSSVRLATADGVPYEVLTALRDVPVPPALRCSPWLTEHRPVLVRDGVADIGGMRLHYSEQGGLTFPYPESDEQDGDQ